jgi:hypothetical protein
MFRELLTPDFNADHWDHFHLGVDPLSGSPVGTIVKKKKPPPKERPAAAPQGKPEPEPDSIAEASEPIFVPDDPPSEEPEFVPDSKPAKADAKKRPKKSRRAPHHRPKRSARAHGPKHKT